MPRIFVRNVHRDSVHNFIEFYLRLTFRDTPDVNQTKYFGGCNPAGVSSHSAIRAKPVLRNCISVGTPHQ